MSTFILKLIACLTMLGDHIGRFSYLVSKDTGQVLRIFGRISFPIFAYLLALGFTKTNNKYRYLSRLIIFGLISEIPYNYCFYNRPPLFSSASGKQFAIQIWKSFIEFNNVYYTLALGLLAIIIYDIIIQKCDRFKLLAILPVIAFSAIAHWLDTDYGAYGVLLIFFFYFTQNNKIATALVCAIFACRKILEYFVAVLLNINISANRLDTWDVMQLFAFCAIVPILCYSGKFGPKPKSKIGKICLKYFFYMFYPLHLLILGIIVRR